MVLKSSAGLNAFKVLFGASLVLFVVLIAVMAVLLLCRVAVFQNRLAAVVVATLAVSAQMVFTLMMSFLSGFNFVHPAVSFIIAALLWIPTVMFGMTMTGSAWRTAFLITKQARDRDKDDVVKRSPCAPLVSLSRAVFLVTKKNPFVFWVTSIFAFAFVLSVVIAMADICYCSNPVELSTWTSRRSVAHFCQLDEFCHLYPMLGVNSSRLRIVGHVVTAGVEPSAHLETCEADTTTHECLGAAWQTTAKVLNHAHITEDPRYVMHGLLNNLTGMSVYRVVAVFTLGAGVERRKTLVVRAVPDPNSNVTVSLVGGGDYHATDKGLRMLLAGVQAQPKAHALFLGGDIAYANNMRSCYLRWDRVLQAVSAVVNDEGHALPIVTVPGNHEGGGYLVESSPSDYYFYTQYFPQYDEDDPADTTTTYHSHIIGKRVGIVCLDSEIIIPIEQQKAYLAKMLTSMRGVDPAAGLSGTSSTVVSDMRFVIVLYHNAAYPGTVERTSGPHPLVREHFVPIFDTHKVPLVLEFHEHVYKRTKPLTNGKPTGAGLGVVYVGDGCLGLSSGRELGDATYIERSRQGNYVTAIDVYINGTAHVVAAEANGDSVAIIDKTELQRRF
jgi:hypothetical protein